MRARRPASAQPSLLTRWVQSVFDVVAIAEFEILFVAFFFIVFFLVKDLTAHPDFNQIFVKKPALH